MKNLAVYLLFILSSLCVFTQDNIDTNLVNEIENEILWDTWGIPHIYGSNESNLYKMMGWAQMRNHGNLILKLYGESRARGSEYFGDSPEKDILLHKTGVLDMAKKSWDNMSAKNRKIVQAFVEGINAYAKKYPAEIEEKYKRVLPVKPLDVVNHLSRVLYLEFLINSELRQAQAWKPGSNAWAINGSKTATGNTMLLANPHLMWKEFWLFFEAQLTTKNNNLYGVTLVGLPTLGIAFNEHLGWTHTVNTLDNVDLYELTIKNNQYLIDGKYKDFKIDTTKVKVTKNGLIEEQMVVKKSSNFGMVIKESGNKALAIRWPNMDGKFDVLSQWKAMGDAKNIDEFKNALKQNALPLFNVVYSDKAGNILYHFAGNIPKKNGDWEKWQSVVSTSSSNDIWNDYYNYNALPNYTNPESGWIQNANDPPYTSTFPSMLNASEYASHIAPNYMPFRPQRSARLIMEASNLTLDEFIAIKHDTKSELAIRLKDDFEALKHQTKDSLTLAALHVLTNWDASFDSSSKGALLFTNLMYQMRGQNYFSKKWDYKNPMNTPDGFNDTAYVLKTLKSVAQDMNSKLGSLDTEYGSIFKLKVGDYEYPGNGGPSSLGLFRTVHYVPGDDGRFYPIHGETYVCATEFGASIQAKALLSYGNATQPNNPHIGDQLELLAKKKLRKVWFTRTEQEENLELREGLITMD